MKAFIIWGVLLAAIFGAGLASRDPAELQHARFPQVHQYPAANDRQGHGAGDASARHEPTPPSPAIFQAAGPESQKRPANPLADRPGEQNPPSGDSPESLWSGLKVTDLVIAATAVVGIAVAAAQLATYKLQARIMRQQAVIMRHQLSAAKEASEIAKTAADAAAANAKRALLSDSPVMLLVDCSWVQKDGRPFAPKWGDFCPEGQSFEITPRFTIKNFGKNPAICYSMRISQQLVPMDAALSRKGMFVLPFTASDVIESGQSKTFCIPIWNKNVDSQIFNKIARHQIELYFVAEFRFSDFTGEEFEAGYCGYWDIAMGGLWNPHFVAQGPRGFNYHICTRYEERPETYEG